MYNKKGMAFAIPFVLVRVTGLGLVAATQKPTTTKKPFFDKISLFSLLFSLFSGKVAQEI